MNLHRTTTFNVRHHYQRGVNLIEIMVSMVIGLFLVLGATTLYVKSKKSSDVDDSIARVQETSRYALSVLETDIRMANYWGLVKDSTSITNRSTASALTAGTNADDCGIGYAVQVGSPIGASNNGYTLSCAANQGALTSADTLTVRRAATTASDHFLLLCSTRQNAFVMLKGTDPCTNGELHNLIVNAYYVDQGSDQSNTLPSLRRKTLGDNSTGTGPGFADTEIIPGVEDMQVQLGWASSTNSAAAVEYLQPGSGAAPANGQVVAVRIWLLVRAETPDYSHTDSQTYQYGDRSLANGAATTILTANRAYAPGDHYQRLLVSRTIFLRNATGT